MTAAFSGPPYIQPWWGVNSRDDMKASRITKKLLETIVLAIVHMLFDVSSVSISQGFFTVHVFLLSPKENSL